MSCRHEELVLALLMGSNRNCITIFIMFLLCKHVSSSSSSSRDSLNSLVYDYAFKTTHKPRTGFLYEVSLPQNLTGMEASVIRLRAHSLWRNGANFSSVKVPTKTLPLPFTRRVDIVYQNLGNWSISYYNVPNYTLVAPVIGVLVYDANTGSITHPLIELNLRGDDPIIVRFDGVSVHEDYERMRCVRFSSNGSLELSNVSEKSSCETRNEGHFSIVVPSESKKKEKTRVLRWWMVGIPAGILGLVMIGVMGFVLLKWKRFREMEKQSERSEGLDTIWIGNSRMPSASGIRTQPILEHTYLP